MKGKFLTLLVTLSAGAGICWAQPADEPGKAQNPQNPPAANADANKAAIEKGMAAGREAAEKFMAMTPAQQREWMDQMQEQTLKTLMKANGMDDLELQEKVVLFMREQSASRLHVRELAARLRDALADKKSTDATLSALIDEYVAATQTERERRDKAESVLREELEFQKNPRLEGMLQLYGGIGDSAWLTGGSLMSGMMSLSMLPTPNELAAKPKK